MIPTTLCIEEDSSDVFDAPVFVDDQAPYTMFDDIHDEDLDDDTVWYPTKDGVVDEMLSKQEGTPDPTARRRKVPRDVHDPYSEARFATSGRNVLAKINKLVDEVNEISTLTIKQLTIYWEYPDKDELEDLAPDIEIDALDSLSRIETVYIPRDYRDELMTNLKTRGDRSGRKIKPEFLKLPEYNNRYCMAAIILKAESAAYADNAVRGTVKFENVTTIVCPVGALDTLGGKLPLHLNTWLWETNNNMWKPQMRKFLRVNTPNVIWFEHTTYEAAHATLVEEYNATVNDRDKDAIEAAIHMLEVECHFSGDVALIESFDPKGVTTRHQRMLGKEPQQTLPSIPVLAVHYVNKTTFEPGVYYTRSVNFERALCDNETVPEFEYKAMRHLYHEFSIGEGKGADEYERRKKDDLSSSIDDSDASFGVATFAEERALLKAERETIVMSFIERTHHAQKAAKEKMIRAIEMYREGTLDKKRLVANWKRFEAYHLRLNWFVVTYGTEETRQSYTGSSIDYGFYIHSVMAAPVTQKMLEIFGTGNPPQFTNEEIIEFLSVANFPARLDAAKARFLRKERTLHMELNKLQTEIGETRDSPPRAPLDLPSMRRTAPPTPASSTPSRRVALIPVVRPPPEQSGTTTTTISSFGGDDTLV
jgi:hypothetical protein